MGVKIRSQVFAREQWVQSQASLKINKSVFSMMLFCLRIVSLNTQSAFLDGSLSGWEASPLPRLPCQSHQQLATFLRSACIYNFLLGTLLFFLKRYFLLVHFINFNSPFMDVFLKGSVGPPLNFGFLVWCLIPFGDCTEIRNLATHTLIVGFLWLWPLIFSGWLCERRQLNSENTLYLLQPKHSDQF